VTSASPGPLAGITVLDLSTVLAGPVTATFLGDFGADVVKVEEPGRGDFTRARPDGGRSPHWAQEARNKRSITCNLRDPRGQDLVRRLVPHFDVVVTNFRPPTLDAWGLSPDALLALSPRSIIACITAYGLTGPYRDRGAFDRVASSYSGLTYTTGYPEQPPVRSGYALIDYMSAYLAAFGVVTALYHRDARGGAGQVLDLALYEPAFRASEDALVHHSTTGEVRQRSGNLNARIVPATDVDTADGRRVSVHAGTDALFAKLAGVIGRPELAQDPDYATRDARIAHQDSLYALLRAWAAGQQADELVRRCSEAGVPAAPLMTIDDIAADEHYLARGSITVTDDPDFGRLPMPAVMPRLSATPGSIRSNGPTLGDANEAVYGGLLGLTEPERAALVAAGVV
jgi:crotonobetainyl-CoA:carnitine CoA-transferase CaiB-like acyl-CoA transferase